MASSRAASTSSKIQNGTGRTFKMENNRAIAVNARSPPDNKLKFCSFFPGGCATISTPVFNKSSELVNLKSALPPPNSSLKTDSK